jgi:hypothetical protein
MKAFAISLGLLAFAFTANAAVNIDVPPASLVASETEVEASTSLAVFEFGLTATDSETIESVSITLNSASATVDDINSIDLYSDDGDGVFDDSVDTEIGSETDIIIGSEMVIEVTGDNALVGDTMFVILQTSSDWDEVDDLTVTFNANGIITSADSPIFIEITTSAIVSPEATPTPTPTPTPSTTPTPTPTPTPVDDFGVTCSSGIVNGKLYKVEGSETVYLAAACQLKPFRGTAVFHARGHKFQNITTLASLNGVTVASKPALPAGGTLVKGSAQTVWFVTEDGKKKGFTSSAAFTRLGFNFGSVKTISDTDLNEIETSENVTEQSTHPEGAVVKCTTSSTVYMMKGNKKFAFTNPQPYLDRGHTWDAIAVIDCQSFKYEAGSNIAS